MILEQAMKEQLKDIFAALTSRYTFDIHVANNHSCRTELLELLNEVAECSEKLSCRTSEGNGLLFNLLKDDVETGISFRGIPNGHEFTSLLLAILNADGKGKNLPDDVFRQRIHALKGKIALSTYVSLTCTSCPDVVQSLNVFASISPRITHEMVDGAINQDEVNALQLQGVPSVFANGKLLHVGSGNMGALLGKLEDMFGSAMLEEDMPIREYDVIVLGGGPAGSSAAIYAARKGLKVAVVAERIGGQIKETVGIENMISVPKTTGAQLAADLLTHLHEYPIDIFENRIVTNVSVVDGEKTVTVRGGEKFRTRYLIVATGSSWRRLNIPGEAEYIGRGVAFCTHCDGPFYKGKDVAVIGGGNSGMEAALDLAGICNKVTVFEFLDELRADNVLQDKARRTPNIEIFTSSQSLFIEGNGEKVTGIHLKNRHTEEERTLKLDGVFVQIGLSPNGSLLSEWVTCNSRGEILIDEACRTSAAGIYAAGDVSSVPYKQIIIAMGEGAKAALSMFDDRMRSETDA